MLQLNVTDFRVSNPTPEQSEQLSKICAIANKAYDLDQVDTEQLRRLKRTAGEAAGYFKVEKELKNTLNTKGDIGFTLDAWNERNNYTWSFPDIPLTDILSLTDVQLENFLIQLLAEAFEVINALSAPVYPVLLIIIQEALRAPGIDWMKIYKTCRVAMAYFNVEEFLKRFFIIGFCAQRMLAFLEKDNKITEENFTEHQRLVQSRFLDSRHSTSLLVHKDLFYSAEEVNSLLTALLAHHLDGQKRLPPLQANVIAPQAPYVTGAFQAVSRNLFYDTVSEALKAEAPTVIPINTTGQHFEGLPLPSHEGRRAVGTHWVMLFINPKKKTISYVDPFGNGTLSDIRWKMDDTLPVDDEGRPFLFGLTEVLLPLISTQLLSQSEDLSQWTLDISGTCQQVNDWDCGPLGVQNAIDYLSNSPLTTPMRDGRPVAADTLRFHQNQLLNLMRRNPVAVLEDSSSVSAVVASSGAGAASSAEILTLVLPPPDVVCSVNPPISLQCADGLRINPLVALSLMLRQLDQRSEQREPIEPRAIGSSSGVGFFSRPLATKFQRDYFSDEMYQLINYMVLCRDFKGEEVDITQRTPTLNVTVSPFFNIEEATEKFDCLFSTPCKSLTTILLDNTWTTVFVNPETARITIAYPCGNGADEDISLALPYALAEGVAGADPLSTIPELYRETFRPWITALNEAMRLSCKPGQYQCILPHLRQIARCEDSGALAVTNALAFALDKPLGKPRCTAENPNGFALIIREQHQRILAKLERHSVEFAQILSTETTETSAAKTQAAPT